MMTAPRIASIGECMIELWQDERDITGLMHRTYGGDTLNTAVYLARCLRGCAARVDYVTALGDDPFSTELIRCWQAEGVGTDCVIRLPGALPGLYIIRTDTAGERSFYYWRGAAAVRQLFANPQTDALLQNLVAYDLVYLSGITLAIFDDASRERLMRLLEQVRRRGGRVAFDSNYRPRLWADVATAQHWMGRAFALADFAFPTFDDEQALWHDPDPEATAARIQQWGVGEVIVKRGPQPCLIAAGSGRESVAAESVARVVDTTAAGDAFNAAYLGARLQNAPPAQAARAGHRLAARVIGQRGAIIAAD